MLDQFFTEANCLKMLYQLNAQKIASSSSIGQRNTNRFPE